MPELYKTNLPNPPFMNNAYLLNPDGSSNPLQRIRCSDEAMELQDILEKNLDLIPGDQINPKDSRRWTCVKFGLPIEDPTTGDNRWRCDYLNSRTSLELPFLLELLSGIKSRFLSQS